jgi:predicted AlkP superfamily pyrophosphatase or phosphodiesterase
MKQKTPSHKNIFMILMDNSNPEVFYKFVDEGLCPTISKYLLGEKINGKYSKASYSSNIITGLPSTSANSHVSIATGCYARKNNFLYTNFWDLTGKKAKIVESEKISPLAIRRFQTLINNKTKTLMEYFKDSISFHALYKGAKVRYMRTRSLIWNFLPWAIRDDEFLADPNFWKTTFLKFILDFLKIVKRKKKMPGATFMAYLMTDQTSHLFGFDSPEYRSAVSTLDYLLSVLIEGYTKKNGKKIPGLKDLGFLDDIIWVICSDHGSRKIYSDIYIMLGEKVRFDQDLNLSQGLLRKDKKFAKRFENRYHEFDGFIWTTNGLMFLWFSNPSGVNPSVSKSNLDQFKQFYFEEQWRQYVPKKKNRRDDKPIDLIEIFTQLKSIAFAVIPEPISETFMKPKGIEPQEQNEQNVQKEQ